MEPRLAIALGVLNRLKAESASTAGPASECNPKRTDAAPRSLAARPLTRPRSPTLLSTDADIFALADPVPSVPCRPASYAADGANRPARLEYAIPGLVCDIAPNVAPGALPPHLQSVRYSISMPHVEPMRASGPSTARVAAFRRTMRGEGMAVEGHMGDGPLPLPLPLPSSSSSQADGEEGWGAALPPLASLAPPLQRKEVRLAVGVCARDSDCPPSPPHAALLPPPSSAAPRRTRRARRGVQLLP
jgi:hypothetical protein